MIRRPFTVDLGAGTILRGDALVPEGPPPRSAVVLVHGFRGSRALGFFPAVARALVAAGHAVVAFDFSGAGTGADPERITDLAAFASNTFSREVAELERVLTLVRRGVHLTRRPDRVGLMGFARGGTDAVLAAAGPAGDEPVAPVDALVTWSAPARLDRWNPGTLAAWEEEGRVYVPDPRTGRQLPLDVGLLRDFQANRDRLDVLGAAARIDVPWLVVHGSRDEVVDLEEARALLGGAGPSARLLLVEGAGHGFGSGHPFRPDPSFERVLGATVRHFDRHLRERRRV